MLLAMIDKKDKLFNITFILVTILFSSSFGFGFDWMNYYYNYIYIESTSVSPFEPGFFYTMKLGNYLGLNFPQVLSIVTLIMYCCTYKFCKNCNSKNVAFFIIFSLLSFYMFNEQIRQGLAISIIMLGMSTKKKLNKNFLFLIAILFHYSAFICFILNPFFNVKGSERDFKIRFFSVTIFVLLVLFIFSNPNYISFIPYVFDKVSGYSSGYSEASSSIIQYILQSRIALIYLLIGIIIFYSYKKLNNQELKSSFLAIYFLFLTKLSFFLLRFGYYIIPHFVKGIDKYYSSGSRNFRYSSIRKLSVLFLVFFVSTAPMWKLTYRMGAEYRINIFSDKNEIQNTIAKKCNVISLTDYGNGLFSLCR